MAGCSEKTSNRKIYCKNHTVLEPTLDDMITPDQFRRTEDPEATTTKRRTAIPAKVRELVWSKYINPQDGECYCCRGAIKFGDCHAGHVIPHCEGGSSTLDNLRPVCPGCNLSMGSMRMYDYVRKYGLKGEAAKEWPGPYNGPSSTPPSSTGIGVPSVRSSSSSTSYDSDSYSDSYSDSDSDDGYQYAIPSSSTTSRVTRDTTPPKSEKAAKKVAAGVTKKVAGEATKKAAKKVAGEATKKAAKKVAGEATKKVAKKVGATGKKTVDAVNQPTSPLRSTVGNAVRAIAPIIDIDEDGLDQLLADFNEISLVLHSVGKPSSQRK